MARKYYQFSLAERRRRLAEAGFERDRHGIWSHRDGRALGEGVAAALTDEALLRYLGITPRPNPQRKKRSTPES